MPEFTRPGVYVEEISSLPPTVEPVETAVPAFVGYTGKATDGSAALRMRPAPVRSLAEYVERFGAGPDNGPAARFHLYHSLRLYFANGGGRCLVVSVGDYSAPPGPSALLDGLERLAREDEPTILAFPDAIAIASNAFYDVQTAALRQCGERRDRIAVLDLLQRKDGRDLDLRESVKDFRDRIGNDHLSRGAAYVPHLEVVLPDPAAPGKNAVVPPSGVVAGVYCQVDRARGVHEAPANVSLRGVEVGFAISDADQENLRVGATSGKSINAIRCFPGRGTLVWGARTLDGSSDEWRCVSVRRLTTMIERSVGNAVERFVFEPNDRDTWARTRGMIERFLLAQWRDGALQGASPDEAYFVKVGLGETMTAVDVFEGRMILEIGIAALKPAEFIVLRFSQKMPVP